MTLELLTTIAMLCLTPTGRTWNEATYNFQLNCQKEYLVCINKAKQYPHKKKYTDADFLFDCIADKEKK